MKWRSSGTELMKARPKPKCRTFAKETRAKRCRSSVISSSQLPDPVAPCPPVSLRNGVAVVSASPDGRERAEFRCNERFVLWGSPEVECDGRTDGR